MSDAIKNAFLVYRPVLDYEESEEAHLIALSEETAKRIVAEVQKHAEELCAKLKPVDSEMLDKEYFRRSKHNDRVLSNAVYPYGIDYHYDLEQGRDGREWSAKSKFITYRPLPLIEEGGQG